MQIQDLVKGVLGSEAKSCWHSKADLREQTEQIVAGVWGPLKGLGSFWVYNTQICILPHSRDSFSLILTSISTPKVDKNRTLDCTSFNSRHSYIYYTCYLIFMKKLCFDWMTWGGMLSKVRLENFMTWVVKNRSIVWLVTHCFNLMSQSVSSKCKFTFKNR